MTALMDNAVIIVIIINKATEAKHQFFLSVLKRMRANNQAEDIESLDDYTRVWSDQIDRGGRSVSDQARGINAH